MSVFSTVEEYDHYDELFSTRCSELFKINKELLFIDNEYIREASKKFVEEVIYPKFKDLQEDEFYKALQRYVNKLVLSKCIYSTSAKLIKSKDIFIMAALINDEVSLLDFEESITLNRHIFLRNLEVLCRNAGMLQEDVECLESALTGVWDGCSDIKVYKLLSIINDCSNLQKNEV